MGKVIDFNKYRENQMDFMDVGGEFDPMLEEYMREIEGFSEEKKKLMDQALADIEEDKYNIQAMCTLAQMEPDLTLALDDYTKIIEVAREKAELSGFDLEGMKGSYGSSTDALMYLKVLCDRADFLSMLGRYSESVSIFEEILTLEKKDVFGITASLAGLYLVLERFDEAKALLDKMEEDTENTMLLYTVYLYKTGNYRECENSIFDMQDLNPFMIDLLLLDELTEEEMEDLSPAEEQLLLQAEDALGEQMALLCSVPGLKLFIGNMYM